MRIYSVVYDNEDLHVVDALVYAEDLSTNGTYWNGSLIGRGCGGFLLSHDDQLKLGHDIILRFEAPDSTVNSEHFDSVQETEMLVGLAQPRKIFS